MVKAVRVTQRIRFNISVGLATCIALFLLTACGSSNSHKGATSPTTTAKQQRPLFDDGQSGVLQPGSDPSVLPSSLLIADRDNNRLIIVNPQGKVEWQFPQPGDLAAGETFKVPDDAFFTPDGKQIVVTQEDDFVVTVIDIASHKIVYRYGTPGEHGSGPNQVWNPDDALMLKDGSLLFADIKNCRILHVAAGAHEPQMIYGTTTNTCVHNPPGHYGSPNGAFPLSDGNFLVTEINGSWVDWLSLDGTVSKSLHLAGINYPSDSNEMKPGEYVTVDYSSPGQIETFDASGNVLWRYQPQDGVQLNDPSLAFGLPNGDIICNDDANNRVIVVDPKTNKVVWQYGVTHKTGSTEGLLDHPDGMDLAPPYSMIIAHSPH